MTSEAVVNHPNRSKRGYRLGANPTPEQVATARCEANLSQREAAALIYATERTWQDWEGGQARMHPGLWELFQIKLRMIDEQRMRPPSP